MVSVGVIKLVVRINPGPGAQTYSGIILDQEDSGRQAQ